MINKIKNYWNANKTKICDHALGLAVGAGLTFMGYCIGYTLGTSDTLVDIVRKNEGNLIHF